VRRSSADTVGVRVIGCCTHLTDVNGPWRRADYNAHDFVFAVKDRQLNGYAWIPCRGIQRYVNNGNRDLTLQLFGEMAADIEVEPLPIADPCLIPVPNGYATIDGPPPRTLAQARAYAVALGGAAKAVDLFRWAHVMPSASRQGGTRDPQQLYEALRTRAEGLKELVRDRPCALVDDVLTSGGHLQACAAALKDLGHRAVVAVVAGVSDQEQIGNPFGVRMEEIEDFTPNPRRRW
jgi:phosphoribosylpyrophosphate synthetase